MVNMEEILKVAQKENDTKEFKRIQGLMLCILNDCTQKQVALERAKNEYDKIQAQYQIAKARLERLEKGDWLVINEIEKSKDHE